VLEHRKMTVDVIHSARLLQHRYLRVNLRHSRREYGQLKLGHDFHLYQPTPMEINLLQDHSVFSDRPELLGEIRSSEGGRHGFLGRRQEQTADVEPVGSAISEAASGRGTAGDALRLL
jgi:hypothetical protein